MRKLVIPVFILMFLTTCQPASQGPSSFAFSFEVYNPLDVGRKNVLIRFAQHDLGEMVPDFNFETPGLRVVDREAEIASEYNMSLVVVLDSMKAKETRKLNVYYISEARNYRKRTQAELSHKSGGEWKNREYIGGQFRNVETLRVPPEHKDHSWFLRYEGPGWESDKVGYRLYLDQRNAIDVFGKKTNDMVLMGIGQDNFNSYHEMQSWGMDVMKVGKSLGLGSIGMWTDTSAVRVENTDSVMCYVANGNIYSSISVNYFGWKTQRDTMTIRTDLSINAGTRVSTYSIYGDTDTPISTGIVKDKLSKVYKKEGDDSSYGYIATYGKQSLNNDNLGLVVMFSNKSFIGFHEDFFSHVVELKPNADGETEYKFGAAWELEPNGITNEKDFIKWVEKSARELANPVTIHVNQ